MTDEEKEKMWELLRSMNNKLSIFCSQVADHHKDLNGNGQKGVKDRLRILEVRQDECPARADYKRDNKMFVVAVLSMIVAAGSFLWTILK